MSYAEAGCAALAEAMRADARVVALGEDVGRGGIFGQYKGLAAEFGAVRVIDTPISEATIMGAAVGMALAGLKPVVEMRVADFAFARQENQHVATRIFHGDLVGCCDNLLCGAQLVAFRRACPHPVGAACSCGPPSHFDRIRAAFDLDDRREQRRPPLSFPDERSGEDEDRAFAQEVEHESFGVEYDGQL